MSVLPTDAAPNRFWWKFIREQNHPAESSTGLWPLRNNDLLNELSPLQKAEPLLPKELLQVGVRDPLLLEPPAPGILP